jgi:hypothetical protein
MFVNADKQIIFHAEFLGMLKKKFINHSDIIIRLIYVTYSSLLPVVVGFVHTLGQPKITYFHNIVISQKNISCSQVSMQYLKDQWE